VVVTPETLDEMIRAVVEHAPPSDPVLVYMRPETRSALLQAMTTGSIRRARWWAQRARRLRGRR
jgi:hypothetical protein